MGGSRAAWPLPVGLLLAFVLATLLAWLPAVPAQAVQAMPPLLRIERAVLTTPAGSQPVALPHVLDDTLFKAGGRSVTFQVVVDLPQPPAGPLGVFIEKASLAGHVTLNGHDLGSCGAAPLPQLRCINQPLWLNASRSLWRQGPNVIEVEVWGTNLQMNGLSTIIVGEAEETWRTYYLPQSLLRVTLPQALAWATLVLGLVSLGVATVLRNQPLYLWFGLAAVLRGIGGMYPVLTTIWGDPQWVHWAFMSARISAAALTVLAMLALFARRMPRLERVLVGYALAIPALLAMGHSQPQAVLWLGVPLLVVGAILTVQAAHWTWRSPSWRGMLLMATVLALIASGAHDMWRLSDDDAFTRLLLLPFASALMLLAMGGVIVRRVSRGLHTSQNLNTILADRVAAHEADLLRKHQTILNLERNQARVQERERFLRDLHDGLGSSLSAIRLRLDDDMTLQQLRRMIDECLDDMRLLLATSAGDGDLGESIADLRWRLDRRRRPDGPQLRWHVALAGMPPLPASPRLQLLRVLQEAAANALHHARAQTIHISVRYEAETRRLHLAVEDDGQGFSTRHPAGSGASGRGLANLRYRAGQLRATMDIDSSSSGTCVRLTWDLPADTH